MKNKRPTDVISAPSGRRGASGEKTGGTHKQREPFWGPHHQGRADVTRGWHMVSTVRRFVTEKDPTEQPQTQHFFHSNSVTSRTSPLPSLCHPEALPLFCCECPAPTSAYCTQACRPSIWLDMDYMSDGHTCTKWPLIFFKLTVISKCKTLSPPAAAEEAERA